MEDKEYCSQCGKEVTTYTVVTKPYGSDKKLCDNCYIIYMDELNVQHRYAIK